VKPGNRRPSSFDFVFQTPKELSNEPKSLRNYLFSDASHTLSDRFKLAKQLAKSISYVHTLGFVHKNVRPETILEFQDSKSAPGSIFLTGFEKVRMSHGRSRLAGDSAWEKNLYRHPHRQGVSPEETYVMQHDIYSLVVCLLEIGMWESFVLYENDATAPVPAPGLGIALGATELSRPVLIKEHVVTLAKHDPPKRNGRAI
jgi:serine/threonine protein kinase